MSEFDILKIAKDLVKKEDNIYYSTKKSAISYPEDGNKNCMQIEDISYWFKHRNNVIINAVKKLNNNVFFDVGGGNGFVSKGLQDAGINVVLVEPGYQGAKNAKKRNITNVVCSTLEDANFENSSIDSIGLFDVIEHIEDDQIFINMIYKYLKSEGLVFITVPAYNLLWSDEDKNAGHYRRYTLKKIKKVLSNAGFKIQYSTYIFSILPLPIFLFRTLPSILKSKKKSGAILKLKNDHKANSQKIDNIMLKIWNWELKKINNSKKILFGGSCFVIGKK